MREMELKIRPPAPQKKRLYITSIITTNNIFHSAASWTWDKPISALSCVSVNLRHLYGIIFAILKYNLKLVQNSSISPDIPWRDIPKLPSAQSFRSSDVWLESDSEQRGGEKKKEHRGQQPPLTIIYFIIFYNAEVLQNLNYIHQFSDLY